MYIQNPVSNGINYQPQLVCRISSINSIFDHDLDVFWVKNILKSQVSSPETLPSLIPTWSSWEPEMDERCLDFGWQQDVTSKKLT